MFNHDKSGLLIFDNFQIDFKLPKWEVRKTDSPNGTPNQVFFPRINRRNGELVMSNMGFFNVVQPMQGVGGSSGEIKKPSLFERIFHRKRYKRFQQELADAITNPNFTVETFESDEVKKSRMSVEDFFKSIKNSAEELVMVEERLKTFTDAMEHLKKTGQYALIEIMQQDLEVHRAETQLYAIGLRKVITEKNITDFASKSPRAIKLDWVQNFTRLIPAKALDIKLNADEKHIFDNYVVMHYDPDNKGSMDTVAEKIKKKDPILFGVIAGSNKLYYIACWEDEYCDLTFDKLVDTLGDKAITANDLTATVQISE